MCSRKDYKVNFDKLEEELRAAEEADNKYQRENDAKFRAVYQKVGSYEEFRDIVLASNLKPLEKTDKINQSFKQPWNTLANKNKSADDDPQFSIDQKSIKLPSNGHEFANVWKHKCKTSEDRNRLLLELGTERLSRIFHAEISYGLLGEIIIALNDQYKDDESASVLQILECLSEVNRFRLSWDFLTKTEKDTSNELFSKLDNTILSSEELKNKLEILHSKYA